MTMYSVVQISLFKDLLTQLLLYLGNKISEKQNTLVEPSQIKFENKVFSLHYYCNCDVEDCKYCREDVPLFVYKPTGFNISWYKYIGRSMDYSDSNGENSIKTAKEMEVLKMFTHCIESLEEKIHLNTMAKFTWNFGSEFLLAVPKDKNNVGMDLPNEAMNFYVWSSPEYNGNNTISPLPDTINPLNFTHEGFCGRDKGWHIIADYCGENVRFVDCE